MLPIGCVYRKLKSERSDGEAHRGLGVNESFRPDESDEKSAHPCAETDVFWLGHSFVLGLIAEAEVARLHDDFGTRELGYIRNRSSR
jgi:hypothetical protein